MTTIHWHQTLTCPHCYSTATVDMSLVEGKHQPAVGDAFLCSFCGAPSLYDDHMALRIPEPGELTAIEGTAGYREAQAALKEGHR